MICRTAFEIFFQTKSGNTRGVIINEREVAKRVARRYKGTALRVVEICKETSKSESSIRIKRYGKQKFTWI